MPSKRATFPRGASVSSKFLVYSCSSITLSLLWPSAFDFNQPFLSVPCNITLGSWRRKMQQTTNGTFLVSICMTKKFYHNSAKLFDFKN
jgi:hypothetical protein